MSAANIHASCVLLARAGETFGAPADAGILLLGESGSGKSLLALRLIERGAKLVADDRCELFVEGRALFARPPQSLRGLIEVRGVGIVALPYAERAHIALTIMCGEKPSRLPERRHYSPPPALALPAPAATPLIALDASDSAATARVCAAAAAFARGLFRENAAKT